MFLLDGQPYGVNVAIQEKNPRWRTGKVVHGSSPCHVGDDPSSVVRSVGDLGSTVCVPLSRSQYHRLARPRHELSGGSRIIPIRPGSGKELLTFALRNSLWRKLLLESLVRLRCGQWFAPIKRRSGCRRFVVVMSIGCIRVSSC